MVFCFADTIAEPFSFLFKYRKLLYQTIMNDIRVRYAGSLLGLSWVFLYPLIFLLIYAITYVFVFRAITQEFSEIDYVLFIFCGLIPFLGFIEALGYGIGSVTRNTNLIKNTLFPIDLIPVKDVLASQITQIISFLLLVFCLIIFNKITIWILMIPVIWFLQLLFTIGLLWILSSINVYLKELQNNVNIICLILMLASPIAYTMDMIPKMFQFILYLNPLYYIIVIYQDCLLYGKSPQIVALIVLLVISFGFFYFGYWFFSKMKKVIIDNV
jgi:lipopolysaccharide transport system permease protein